MERVRQELAATPASVGQARRLVADALRAWDLDALVPDAQQLVSELATNAVLHTGQPLLVEAALQDGRVRLGVSDRSPQLPQRRAHSVRAGTGRGLGLVAALSTSWGADVAAAPWCKTVWCELPLDPALLPAPADGALLVPA